MAYGFGTTVNPQLGAVDYSNYLRGALSGAQMQAQGGAAIGAGVQNALAGIGKGIQGYRQKKEEKRIMEGAQEMLKTIYNQNPEQAQALGINPGEDGEWDYKELRAAVEGAGGPKNMINLGAIINQAAIQKAEAQAEARSRAFQDAYRKAQTEESEARANALAVTKAPDVSPAVRDARAVVNAELEAGTLEEDGVAARFAQLVASGGQDRAKPKAEYGGTYIRRDGSGETLRASLFANGIIGITGSDGEIIPIDQKEWQSVTAGDANLYLDPTQVSKMSQDLIKEENGIRSLTSFFKGIKDLPVGVDKLASRISSSVKAFMGDEDLTQEEVELGISQARQQALLGKIRTDVLGPGVLTENDAQRLIGSLGGDISSVFTQPKVVAQRLYDTLQQKHSSYEDLLRQYNAQVAGRYGSMGYRQRELLPLPSLNEQEEAPAPEGVPQAVWDGWSAEQKDEFRALGGE